MDQQSIPERLRDHLEPGERLLWLGSPDPKWFSWRAVAELVGPVWVELDVDERVNLSFVRIPDVDLALAVAYAAAEEAGIPPPERPRGTA